MLGQRREKGHAGGPVTDDGSFLNALTKHTRRKKEEREQPGAEVLRRVLHRGHRSGQRLFGLNPAMSKVSL